MVKSPQAASGKTEKSGKDRGILKPLMENGRLRIPEIRWKEASGQKCFLN